MIVLLLINVDHLEKLTAGKRLREGGLEKLAA
jgi:hypothetical protein